MSIKDKFKNFFNTDETYEYVQEIEYEDDNNSTVDIPVNSKKKDRNQNVVNLSTISQPVSKVILCEPKSYNEVQEVADHLLNRRAVVINLQQVETSQAKRIVDFLSGTVYAVNGDIQKLGIETFLCTPDNIDVAGSITNIEDEIKRGWK